MSKLLSMPVLLLATLFARQADAQQSGVLLLSPYGVDVNSLTCNVQVTEGSFSSTESINASLQGGTGSEIAGSLTYPGAPSSAAPLTFSFGSGNSAYITNATGGTIIAWVHLSISNYDGTTIDVDGPHQTVTGYYAYLPFPSGSNTYTSTAALGPNDPYGLGYNGPVPVQIDIEYAP